MSRPVLVLLGGLVLACAAFAADEPRNLIYVSGVGEVESEPDIAYVQVGVATDRATAQETFRANNETANRVLAALQALGIAKKDLKTTQFDLAARYEYTGRGERVFKGYHMSHTVLVKVRDLARLGSVLDQAAAAGANDIGGVSFAIEDPAPLEARARASAVKAAIAKAQQLAQAAGVRLGPLVSLSESMSRPRPVATALMRAAPDAEAGANVEPGTMQTSITVNMTYEIAP